jgi:hypothetical protein
MNMNKVVSGAVGMLLLAVPASGSPVSERTKTGEYHVVAGDLDESDPSLQGEFSNAVSFTPRRNEHFVEVAIDDRSGLSTRAIVVQEKDTDMGPRTVLKKEICGRSKSPIRIRTNLDVTVAVQDGPCADGTNAAATTGTVKATFSR